MPMINSKLTRGSQSLILSLLVMMITGCAGDHPSGRHTAEMRAKQICDAVRDYMSKNVVDSLLESEMQKISLENMHVSSDGVIWFGQDWRYEAGLNRLFNRGGRTGNEITCFMINFKPQKDSVIVRDAKTMRYYGVKP